MDKALEIWQEEGLPALKLRNHGSAITSVLPDEYAEAG